MDLALAHRVAGLFAEKGVHLDPWQSVALWHSCRTAKETLLTPKGPETHNISVLGRGRKLIGGTVSVEVDRRGISELLVDGFFPRCQPTDQPKRGRASGFREIGLPFESDTAITRHLAAFLQSHGEEEGKPVRPTHVLLNGGVFKAESLQHRLLEVLSEWFGGGGLSQIFAQRKWDCPLAWCAAIARRPARFGPCRRSRRGLLRLDETSGRREDSRRHGPGILRRHRDLGPCRARRAASVAGVVRRADRHGRRDRVRCSLGRDRIGGGRAGTFPLLQFLGAKERPPGRSSRIVDARRTARDRFA